MKAHSPGECVRKVGFFIDTEWIIYHQFLIPSVSPLLLYFAPYCSSLFHPASFLTIIFFCTWFWCRDSTPLFFFVLLCHVDDCKWVSPLAVHDIGRHTEQQIKRTMLHILPFFSCPPTPPTLTSSLQLATFLNRSSAVWWTPLSSVSCTNERRLHTNLAVVCISGIFNAFTRFFLPPFSHVCEESLYGDATDKPLLDCCACGTAKYRVTFYGNWSEKIHPKDYPREDKSLFFFFFMSPEFHQTYDASKKYDMIIFQFFWQWPVDLSCPDLF